MEKTEAVSPLKKKRIKEIGANRRKSPEKTKDREKAGRKYFFGKVYSFFHFFSEEFHVKGWRFLGNEDEKKKK